MATARGAFSKGDVLAALPARTSGSTLLIQELGGSSPLLFRLKGSFGVEVGAEWGSELRGEVRTPIGSSEGYSTVTGRSWGKTEMGLSLDAAFLRRKDIEVQGTFPPATLDHVRSMFETLQDRGRECLVQLGSLVRRGTLRNVAVAPGRGHALGLDGAPDVQGFNLTLKLTWEWAGRGVPAASASPPASGADVAGKLTASDAAFGAAMAQGQDDFDPDALTAISGAIGKVRGAASQLRRTMRQIGSFAQAPARLINETLAAARSLGNLCNDLDNLLGDTRDAYLALGAAARSTAAALGPRPSALAKAQRAKGAIRGANQQAMEACVDVFDAIAKRKTRRVGVAPGQSLADVARREGGGADAWPEIATFNQLAGQVVPPGVTEVEIPESFYRHGGS